MPQSNDSSPLHFGPQRARFFWEIPNGFSYVLEVPNRRVEEDLVLHEFLEGLSVNEPLDLATRIDDVEQVEPIPTQP